MFIFCKFAEILQTMNRLAVIFAVLIMTAISGCGSGTTTPGIVIGESDTIIKEASYLSVIQRENYVEVNIHDPWHTGKTIGRYALVSRDKAEADAPDGKVTIPEGLTVLKVPLQRTVVYSSVHTAAIEELGAAERICGVADANYFTDTDPMMRRIVSGEVVDIGSNIAPSVEKIIDLEADALLLSPWENGNLGGVERVGVPLVFMADYLERTALGRAEWIKFIGYLYGKERMADSIFNEVRHTYDSLTHLASTSTTRKPKVLTERTYSGVWYVPGGDNYMAKMIVDAGGIHPWADNADVGSLPLDEAAVIDRAHDADCWLIKNDTDLTADALLGLMPHAEAFKAFPNGVYVCNTTTSTLFRDIAFHPEYILADFIRIFHPDVAPNDSMRYYKPLQR